MKKKKIFKILLMVIVILLWSGIILFLSSQNGTETEKTGIKMAQLLKDGLHLKNDVYTIHMKIRKVAHVFLFFGLGMILSMSLFFLKKAKKKVYVCFLVVIGFVFAYFDEAHKIPIEGRHFNQDDVIRNIMGYVTGVVIIFLFFKLRRMWNRKRDG